MLTPAEADAAIAAALAPAATEAVPLAGCAGRVLRQPVHAERDAPPFDRVTMDGIACSASGLSARTFRIAGVQPAGTPAQTLPTPAECIEVMTGAMLPIGCDTVVPIEQLQLQDGRATLAAGCVPEPWRYVHRRAADARAGDRLLDSGVLLGAPEIAVAASAGFAALVVSRLPRIAVISTGDELVEPGVAIAAHQVRRSNTHGLAAALRLAGFAPATDLHLPDDLPALESAFARALRENDVLVLSGGVSAGRFDHVPAALAAAGVRRVFHGVAQRPGRPMWFGIGPDGQAVFALPGNPVSVLVCLARYVIPALKARSGARAQARTEVVLDQPCQGDARLTVFLPVTLRYDREGRARATPRPTGGSGDFLTLAGTGGFVELPPGTVSRPAGTTAPYWRW